MSNGIKVERKKREPREMITPELRKNLTKQGFCCVCIAAVDRRLECVQAVMFASVLSSKCLISKPLVTENSDYMNRTFGGV